MAGGVQGNQVRGITPEGLRIPNPDFQPILSGAKLYSIATKHPCPFSTKIWLSLDINKIHVFGIPEVHRPHRDVFGFLGPRHVLILNLFRHAVDRLSWEGFKLK